MSSGFTLLEIMIAVLVFTIGAVGMIALIAGGLLTSADPENTEIAMNLAGRRMEEIKNLDFADITDESKAGVNIDVDGDAVNDFPGFQSEVDVTESETGLKDVTVSVYWTFKGDEITTSLESYISNN